MLNDFSCQNVFLLKIIMNQNYINVHKMKKIAIESLKVQKTLCYKDLTVILYEVPLKVILNNNIICRDFNGDIVWQVKDIFGGLLPQDSPFINIESFNENKFIAYNFIGGQYYISVKTGDLELINNLRY